jgi:hypothetical protein
VKKEKTNFEAPGQDDQTRECEGLTKNYHLKGCISAIMIVYETQNADGVPS